jgi:hypothetical protein
MPQVLDHAANIYLSVTLSKSSSLFSTPSALSTSHSLLTYQGQVGSLSDVQLYSVPRGQPNWNNIQDEVLKGIREREGVVRVDIVQPPKQRSKRSDELWFISQVRYVSCFRSVSYIWPHLEVVWEIAAHGSNFWTVSTWVMWDMAKTWGHDGERRSAGYKLTNCLSKFSLYRTTNLSIWYHNLVLVRSAMRFN